MNRRTLRQEAEKKYLKKAMRGNTAAFEELVRSHDGLVSSVCLSYLKDPHLAEDAAQETFIKAWRALPKFREDSSFSTWLFTIAKNVCRDLIAKKKDTEELSETLVSEDTVEDQVIKNDEKDAVRRALACLDEDARQILVLREWRGLSYSEISEVLGIGEGTVKSRISRAREKLLSFLKENTEQNLK